MRTSIVAALITGLISFICFRQVPVHAHMEHSGMHTDEPMAAQHRLMVLYAQSRTEINESLKKGDARAIEAETRKLLSTIPELKKVKSHKNRKSQKAMRRIAAAFEADLKTTAARAGTRDFAGARKAFRNAEERCSECHAKFRD
jgi:cysteinyl-tRNA synthetase